MPETADLFVPLLQSDDFAVRATAADALGKTKDRKYLPLLLEAYRASSEATEIEGRVAVLDVLSEYNTSETLEVYKNALLDPEFTIRRHAIDGIKKLVGSQFYWNETVVDPEDFLYRTDKVSVEVAAKYPRDFGEPVTDRIAEMKLEKGIVEIRLCGSEAPGMPIAGKDTGGSQFFITISRQPHLDGNYTIFGEVITGMDVVDGTEIGDRIISVRLK